MQKVISVEKNYNIIELNKYLQNGWKIKDQFYVITPRSGPYLYGLHIILESIN